MKERNFLNNFPLTVISLGTEEIWQLGGLLNNAGD
jgi:hypothetical protein